MNRTLCTCGLSASDEHGIDWYAWLLQKSVQSGGDSQSTQGMAKGGGR